MATNYTFFSSGIIRIGAPGATLSGSDNLINCQDVTFSVAYSQAEVRTALPINEYPTASARYDAVVTLTFAVTEFPSTLLPFILGVSSVSGGGKDTFTGTLTAVPAAVQVIFIGQDQNGKTITITLGNAFIPGFVAAFNRTTFNNNPFTATSFPDGAGTYKPYIIAIDQ